MSAWIDDPMQPTAVAHQRARGEQPQVERRKVQSATHLGVGGVEHLEPAVDHETFDVIGGDPAAGSLRTFQETDVEPGVRQIDGGDEPGHARSDDHHVVICHRDLPGMASFPRPSNPSGSRAWRRLPATATLVQT